MTYDTSYLRQESTEQRQKKKKKVNVSSSEVCHVATTTGSHLQVHDAGITTTAVYRKTV